MSRKMKKMSMVDLNSKDDGGSFDLLLRAAEKASNGDQDLKFQYLTAKVVEDLVNWQYQKAMEGALSVVREEEAALQKHIDDGGSQFVHLCFKIPKKPRCNNSLKRNFFAQPVDDEDDYEKEEKNVRKPPLKKQRRTSNLEKKKKYDDQVQVARCNKSLKRQFFTQPTKEDDDDDYENEEKNVREPPLKKQRRTSNLEEKKKKKYDDQECSNPVASDLPVELKNEIERMKGTDVAMVVQKKLTVTDMDTAQNRLSVPRTKIRNEFLREEERNILDASGGIRVSVIEPCLQLTDLQLKKWEMRTSFLYALIGNWSSISHNMRNQLQPDSEVQLWSFRVGSNLCFALVKV